jgi:hypothetical protein
MQNYETSRLSPNLPFVCIVSLLDFPTTSGIRRSVHWAPRARHIRGRVAEGRLDRMGPFLVRVTGLSYQTGRRRPQTSAFGGSCASKPCHIGAGWQIRSWKARLSGLSREGWSRRQPAGFQVHRKRTPQMIIDLPPLVRKHDPAAGHGPSPSRPSFWCPPRSTPLDARSPRPESSRP